MIRIGELREKVTPMNPTSEGHLMPLMRETEFPNGPAALNHLQKHIDFLADRQLLKIAAGSVYRSLRLTEKGQTYVQPELAEFGDRPMLPDVVKKLEEKIAVLSYPEPEKTGMIQSLRQAVSEKAPDLIAKVIVEIGAKLAGG
jgi:hypothetical protein